MPWEGQHWRERRDFGEREGRRKKKGIVREEIKTLRKRDKEGKKPKRKRKKRRGKECTVCSVLAPCSVLSCDLNTP